MTDDIKIIDSVWFAPMLQDPIGIVIVDNGFEHKAYIGIGFGMNQEHDENLIAARGAKFPLDVARQFI